MNRDEELFALCKEAYEATEWGKWSRPNGDSDQTDAYWKTLKGENNPFISYEHNRYSDAEWIAPLYTSDFLLDKLPVNFMKNDITWYLEMRPLGTKRQWYSDYYYEEYEDRYAFFDGIFADTPLKALLKLTIALADAGEIK